MRIAARTALTMWLVALLTLAAAFWVLYANTASRLERDQHDRLGALAALASAQVSAGSARLYVALARLSLDQRLLAAEAELQRGVFYSSPDAQRALAAAASDLMDDPSLDLLFVLDAEEGGRVLAMGHRRGLDAAEPWVSTWPSLREARDWVREVTVERSGALTRAPALYQVFRGNGRVVLAGGWLLGESALAEVLPGRAEDVSVELRPAGGEPWTQLGTAQSQAVHQSVPLSCGLAASDDAPAAPCPTDSPPAEIVIGLSPAELLARKRELLQVFGFTAAFAALGALLVGVGFSRRLTEPLRALASAAPEVALGAGPVAVAVPTRRDETRELTLAFNAMAQDLLASRERALRAERLAAWRDAARQIAHEIKNPLFPIQMSVETVLKAWERKHERFDGILRTSVETTLHEVARIQRIVTEFSKFAQFPEPRMAPLDLRDIVAQVAQLYAPAAAPNQSLEVPRADSPIWVDGDAQQLEQVVGNLVANALAATLAGGRVKVELNCRAGWVDLEVHDNGPGVPADKRDAVFEPDFTTKAHGTGLGLAIALRIATAHAGTLTVTDSALGGARFVFSLPTRAGASQSLERHAALSSASARNSG
jgi:signal transduction histidine kinase